jgi:hypothetical protein
MLVVMITIFCEVPMARSSLVRSIQSFSAESNGQDAVVASLHCLVISVILQTKETGVSNADNTELDQVGTSFETASYDVIL